MKKIIIKLNGVPKTPYTDSIINVIHAYSWYYGMEADPVNPEIEIRNNKFFGEIILVKNKFASTEIMNNCFQVAAGVIYTTLFSMVDLALFENGKSDVGVDSVMRVIQEG